MKNKTKFSIKCVYCGKRNIEDWKIQFKIPGVYQTRVDCQKCGKANYIEFYFRVSCIEHG